MPLRIASPDPLRRLVWIALALGGLETSRGGEPSPTLPSGQGPVAPSPQSTAPLPVPEGLPLYDLDVRIEPDQRLVLASERVQFTNRGTAPVQELVFHVYPRYRVPDDHGALLAKTIEYLRLSPEEAMDRQGRRLTIDRARVDGHEVPFRYDPELDTILIIPLPRPVPPGDRVVADLDFRLDLPSKWGRWGHHKGVTYLANWYPVLAYHDGQGWERTPFVPWHQPWNQEAGHYTVRLDLPAGQVVASSGEVLARRTHQAGREEWLLSASPSRDFALTCSDRFQAWEREVRGVRVRVTSFPEHESNAQHVLEDACEVIERYQEKFGPYPGGREFEITTAYFGWNGNECSGLVWLDERVMALPSAGRRYLDHLVTHETCHQWWWNAVGTDGYAETFMDEGLVNCFTALRLDEKYGRNAPMITWPTGLGWLPTIGREDLRLSGYYGWRARGGNGSAIRNLDEIGNLNALFSLAYDRGGMVVQMIRNRLGPERFDAFWAQTYRSYAWKTFRYDDLKRELDAYDPAGDWPSWLDAMLVEHRDVDWAIERVEATRVEGSDSARDLRVLVRQKASLNEPTVIRCVCQGGEAIDIPLWPDRGVYEVDGARVEPQGEGVWVVQARAPGRPRQVEVDPEHALLDARPDNNRWKPEVDFRLTPVVTPFDSASIFQPYDRVSLVVGPFVDQYARAGARATLQRLNRWQVTGWAGAEPALREAIFGGQATLFHVPWPDMATGFFYEQGLYNFHNDQRHSGGRFFLRKRLLESSSFIVDDPAFIEAYYGLGNEFWPGDDGRPVDHYLGAVGGRFRLSTLFPYWDPVQGHVVDLAAEYGNSLIGSDLNYTRVVGEVGKVWAIPDGLGLFGGSRFAARLYGGIGVPDTATYFRLGGGRRLRALDLTQEEGSSVWLTTLEWRFPIIRGLDHAVLDHVIEARNLYGALFYDVGQSYFNGRFNPVVHGVGLGLRLDTTFFSFLERASFRLDVAQPIGVGTNRGPTVWFGINHIF